MRLIDKLKYETRPCLVWRHGLGDTLLFYPVYKEICRQTKKKIDLLVESKRHYHLIFPEFKLIEKIDAKSSYSFLYNVKYSEPSGFLDKVNQCIQSEFGLTDYIWQPHKFQNNANNKKSKKIGVNFFGITGNNKESKFCPVNVAEKIWKEIELAGFQPFELYQQVKFTKDYYFGKEVPDKFDLVNKDNSLRFEQPNLKLLFEEIKKCRFVFSTDSGVLYLSLSLLGKEDIVGLENQKKINKYLPTKIKLIDVRNYKEKSVYDYLKFKEAENNLT